MTAPIRSSLGRNYAQCRAHLLERPHRQVVASAHDVLAALDEELRTYRPPTRAARRDAPPLRDDGAGVFVPLHLRTDRGDLRFVSTTTVFGTPIDVTLADLALECFLPADARTAESMRRLAGVEPAGALVRSRGQPPVACGRPW